MLKVELLNFPLNIEQVDYVILFMIYHNIDSIQELVDQPIDNLRQKEDWDERLELILKIIHENHHT
jgi:hypothetical protein